MIRESVNSNLGDFALAKLITSLRVMYYNANTRMMIIRCLRDQIKVLRTGLFFITKLRNDPLKMRVLRVSGTIKKVETMITDYNFKLEHSSKAENYD